MSRKIIPARSHSSVGYRVVSLATRPDLSDQHQTIGGAAWPEFMLHDPVPVKYWEKLMAYFPEYQLSLLADGEIIAVINTVPICVSNPKETLPNRGVDWGVEKSVSDYEGSLAPNTLIGLQVVVCPDQQNKGLSVSATVEMKRLAAQQNLLRVLLPVRPVDKPRYPLIPMDEYINWTAENGEPFDRWLRIHHRLGGCVLSICTESMIIDGSIDDWVQWTRQDFPGSGRYIVDGALNPIDINIAENKGVYREPNVWVVHTINDRAKKCNDSQ